MKRVMAALMLLGSLVLGVLLTRDEAHSQTMPGPNPWRYTMTDTTRDGVVVTGVAGSMTQILTVKDPYGAPIFSVGHVGGAGIYGDHFRVFPPGNVYQPVVDIGPDGRISITGPNAGVWINGTLLTQADIEWIHTQRGTS